MTLVVRIALAALVAAAVIWFMNATEWVEVDVPIPPRGEAARDDLYAARKLLARFGMQVASPTGLDSLPPPGARLLLTSTHWALFRTREQQLQDWVRRGGQLVLPIYVISRPEFDWVPIETRERKRERESDERQSPRQQSKRLVDERGCRKVSDGQATLDVCGWPSFEEMTPSKGTTPSWQLQGEAGIEALRVPFGSGSVTVVAPHSAFGNAQLLRGDNALLFASAVQAQRGAPVWVVSEESREKLIPWTWRQGWIAVLLAAAAIAAGLWRSAVRFGPLALPRLAERRSMAEQVAGTAQFLRRHGPNALLEAQKRALHETAAAQIAGYHQAGDAERIAKLAARTGLPQAQLADAMQPVFDGRKVAARLQLIETARRALTAPRPHRSKDPFHANPT
jgi:hypothetical protein